MGSRQPTTQEIEIRPIEASPEEHERLEEVTKNAFGPDPLSELCFKRAGVPPKPIETKLAEHQRRVANPQIQYRKAVSPDETGDRVLGIVMWYRVDHPESEPLHTPWPEWPAGANLACLDQSRGTLRRWRYEHFRKLNQPYLFLALLAVHPDFQRRGIGGLLLREGLEEADRKGWPCFIEATPVGLGLYRKFGWEETVRSTVNFKDFGGDDLEFTLFGLMRPPKASGKTVG